MVTRRTEGGDVLGESQAVSIKDAIRAYTYNGAYAAFDEDKLGSIEPGKFADMVVLSDVILNIPIDKISETEVLITIMNGKIVYKKDAEDIPS